MLGQRPLIVTIDTSIFETAKYAFGDQDDLGILKKHIQDGNVAGLMISDIVVEESKKHFHEKAEDLNTKLESLIGSREYQVLGGTKTISKMGLVSIDVDKVANEAFAMFKKYLKDTKAQIVSSSGVKIKSILDDYFQGNPPFNSTDKKKKNEFPDAIMIYKIKQLANTYGEICAISADGDWKSAFKNYLGVRFFNSLKELFDFITREKELSEKTAQYYAARKSDINKGIEDELWGMKFEVDGYSYDRKGIVGGFEYEETETKNIVIKSKLNNIDYISENEDEVIATILVQAEFEIECTYLDEGDSVWDSETKDYLYREEGLLVETHSISFYASAKFKIESGEVSSLICVELHLPKLAFNEDTLTERKSRDTDGFISFKRSYICPKCGHVINIDLVDYADTSISRVDGGMGSEFEHAISCEGECPNCGKEYEISGSIFEYPIGACDQDEVKINWK